MEIIDRNGNRRQVSDALYAQGLKGRKALSEELGADGARDVYAQLGVSDAGDLTEAGQKGIKKEAREASRPVIDLEGAVDDVRNGRSVERAAPPAGDDEEEEPEGIFSRYEIGEDGRVRTHEEAKAYRREAPAREAARSRKRMAVGGGVCFAAYRAYKWYPPSGLMLDDRGELAPEGPLETGPNTKYRMADPNDPEEAAYVRVTEDGKTLYRVQALRDITLADGTVVRAGEWGGWIESEDNLSFADDSWVKDEAVACEAARVSGDALLKDEATAGGCARVTDGSVVSDEVVLDERAVVKSGAEVKDGTVVAGYGTVDGAVVEGASVVTGVAEVAGVEAVDIQVGEQADAEARLQEEATLTPEDVAAGAVKAREDAVYGDVAGIDMNAYDHGDGSGVPVAAGPLAGFAPAERPVAREEAPQAVPVAEPAPAVVEPPETPVPAQSRRREPGLPPAASDADRCGGLSYGG